MTEHVTLDPATGTSLVDTRLTVPGMRCAGCIAKIERGLSEMHGVEAARVNFSAKRVAVRHDPAIGEDELVDALLHLGFEAQAVSENPLAEDQGETKKLIRALAVAGFGMMNIMLLSVSVWSGAGAVTKEMFHWLSAVIAIPVVAYSGQPFFSSALMALRYRRTNMDVPISIGVLLATALSVYETITSGEHAYFDGAVMLLFFLLAGRTLDASMRSRTRAGIGALLGRMGRNAGIIQPDGSIKRVEAADIQPGMVMLVAAGEALAADGRVIEGTSSIDNAMLTGESAPEAVEIGDMVHAGAINLLNPVRVEVTAASGDTVIAEIARLMDEAGQSRSRYVRIADRVSRLYAPAVHSLSALAFAGWMIAGAGWHQSLIIAIAVLIITCPCALGLAVPAAQVVASNALLKRGLLVKDGSALERLAEVDTVVFDKTGTLTLGEPRADLGGLSSQDRAIAYALAQTSRHPLSRGLARTLAAAGVTPADLSDVSETGGKGVSGRLGDSPVSLERPLTAQATMAVDLVVGERRSTIGFSDPLRPDAAEALNQLGAMGLSSQIMSGDSSRAVEKVADELGLEWAGAQNPAEKLERLEGMKSGGHKPLMVGDGLNDGPALAAAHASIAPGTASDASQQAADAVFVGDRLMPVALSIKVARRTMDIVRQNFAFAVIYNVCAIPLALFGMVTPMVAAIAMSMSSIIVVGNSLRLAGAAK